MTNNQTDLKWVINKTDKHDYTQSMKCFSADIALKARKFHKQTPGFNMTPLVSLPNLAQMLGVGGIWVKDESKRLQLNSFKILGGSYAVYRYLQNKLGLNNKDLTYKELISNEIKQKLGKITFATATDGNHGRGVAWAAQKLGHSCYVYVHNETAKARIEAIEALGAIVVVIQGNYDDSVRQVTEDSKKNNWAVISDTSWEGYTEIPTWIMQGYTTMMSESQEQFAAQGIIKPTHVFAQAGVGALAAAVIGFYHSIFKENAPKCIVVEPEKADCLYVSAKSGDGKPHTVTGRLDTIMAGLACGEPSPLSWEILKEGTSCFMTCPDYAAAKGMRIYANPLQGDTAITSGESGAATLGALVSIIRDNGELKKALNLDENSQIFFVNSEGDTDPKHYREILWEGANPVPEKFWNEYK